MGKNRSNDFRYIFANAFGLRFSDNDVTLTFGIHEGGDPEDMLEEVAVVMTPRTMKIIVNNISNVIEKFEADVGEIQIPSSKMPSSIEEMLKAGTAVLETDAVAIEKPKEAAAIKKPKKSRR